MLAGLPADSPHWVAPGQSSVTSDRHGYTTARQNQRITIVVRATGVVYTCLQLGNVYCLVGRATDAVAMGRRVKVGGDHVDKSAHPAADDPPPLLLPTGEYGSFHCPIYDNVCPVRCYSRSWRQRWRPTCPGTAWPWPRSRSRRSGGCSSSSRYAAGSQCLTMTVGRGRMIVLQGHLPMLIVCPYVWCIQDYAMWLTKCGSKHPSRHEVRARSAPWPSWWNRTDLFSTLYLD